MRAKHKKTLKDIFDIPVKSNVDWKDVESLLKYLGSEISEQRN